MAEFNSVWQRVFWNHAMREKKMEEKLLKEQEKDTEHAGDILEDKFIKISRRYSNKVKSMVEQTEKTEQSLLILEKYELLSKMEIGKNLKKNKKILKKERLYLINHEREK